MSLGETEHACITLRLECLSRAHFCGDFHYFLSFTSSHLLGLSELVNSINSAYNLSYRNLEHHSPTGTRFSRTTSMPVAKISSSFLYIEDCLARALLMNPFPPLSVPEDRSKSCYNHCRQDIFRAGIEHTGILLEV